MVLTVVTLSHCSEEVVSHHEIYQYSIDIEHLIVKFCFEDSQVLRWIVLTHLTVTQGGGRKARSSVGISGQKTKKLLLL